MCKTGQRGGPSLRTAGAESSAGDIVTRHASMRDLFHSATPEAPVLQWRMTCPTAAGRRWTLLTAGMLRDSDGADYVRFSRRSPALVMTRLSGPRNAAIRDKLQSSQGTLGLRRLLLPRLGHPADAKTLVIVPWRDSLVLSEGRLSARLQIIIHHRALSFYQASGCWAWSFSFHTRDGRSKSCAP
jgi:hypothetical protein